MSHIIKNGNKKQEEWKKGNNSTRHNFFLFFVKFKVEKEWSDFIWRFFFFRKHSLFMLFSCLTRIHLSNLKREIEVTIIIIEDIFFFSSNVFCFLLPLFTYTYCYKCVCVSQHFWCRENVCTYIILYKWDYKKWWAVIILYNNLLLAVSYRLWIKYDFSYRKLKLSKIDVNKL